MERKTRLNVQLADNINEYVKSESKKMGLSQSAFITMCVAQYMQGQEVMQIMKLEQMRMEQLKKSER